MYAISFDGCVTKPRPAAPGDDRPCYVAVLTEMDVQMLRPVHPTLKTGDVVVTRACVREDIEVLADSIRLLIEKP